jgi:hypothetical protein
MLTIVTWYRKRILVSAEIKLDSIMVNIFTNMLSEGPSLHVES